MSQKAAWIPGMIHTLADFLHENPWSANLDPSHLWEELGTERSKRKSSLPHRFPGLKGVEKMLAKCPDQCLINTRGL